MSAIFALLSPNYFLRIRSEWLSATGAAFKIYALQCVCQAFSETAALCLGVSQLLYSRLMPWGVFLAQRHTVHPGAISEIITYNFPSLWVL